MNNTDQSTLKRLEDALPLAAQGEREMVITRVLAAPRALVWRAWTNPQHVARWWGPQGFTNTVHEMDVKPGGVWRYIMHSPDGIDYPNKIEYIEVVEPERLVYWHSDDSDIHKRFHVTVTFDEQNGQTSLFMRVLFDTEAERAQMVDEFGALEGLSSTMDCLTAYLKTMAA